MLTISIELVADPSESPVRVDKPLLRKGGSQRCATFLLAHDYGTGCGWRSVHAGLDSQIGVD